MAVRASEEKRLCLMPNSPFRTRDITPISCRSDIYID
jgi:hypothetical protein